MCFRSSICFILIAFTTLLLYGCNPHYLGNNAVKEIERIYSPDSSRFILVYQLDVGARGERVYQTVLEKQDENKALDNNIFPNAFDNFHWVDNHTVTADISSTSPSAYGDSLELIELGDTFQIAGVKFIVNSPHK